jgi:electron transfer flavoprotein beta subunit
MAASLPCMVEVGDGINKPRYPTMKGRQAARAKRVDTLNLAGLGLSPEEVASGTRVLSTGPAPARAVPRLIDDEAQAVGGIVAFLEEKRLLA